MRDDTIGSTLRGFRSAATAAAIDRPDNSFDRAHGALDNAQRLAARVCALADSLLGGMPEDSSAGNAGLSGGGALGNLADHADRAERAISDAHDALARIERALP